jgi:hypothetical protein
MIWAGLFGLDEFVKEDEGLPCHLVYFKKLVNLGQK